MHSLRALQTLQGNIYSIEHGGDFFDEPGVLNRACIELIGLQIPELWKIDGFDEHLRFWHEEETGHLRIAVADEGVRAILEERQEIVSDVLVTGVNHYLMFLGMMTKVFLHSDAPNWFILSEGLAWKLVTTEVRGVAAEDLVMPVPGFFIEVPAGLLSCIDADGERQAIRAIGVSEMLAGEERRFHCVVINDSLTLEFVQLQLRLVGSLDEILAKLNEDRRVPEIFANAWVGDKKVDDLARSVGLLVFNFLLYLNSPRAVKQHANAKHIEHVKERSKGQSKKEVARRVKKLASVPEWLVGTDVELDPELKQAVKESRTGVVNILRYKVLVRGHWRNQACGPKFADRRLTWIEPYVKGKDLPGLIQGHNYHIKPTT